ncbi:hypothetical protein OTB20_39310 [Streptomyces sp. H27-H1]|uniref:hypothetical protein n=1 Tax=Streptomyces sp. H27-H1 TaxID=2996461 RepID=UPI00226F6A19|nr:hypothetical protein [Streptomyces sp. H27-H1]MCY0932120.1 hypothetical protein [Streptomyces sp. H27-H1]
MNNQEQRFLEAAIRNLHNAQEALHTARQNLTQATLTAYANREPVPRIADRTTRTDMHSNLSAHTMPQLAVHVGNLSDPQH